MAEQELLQTIEDVQRDVEADRIKRDQEAVEKWKTAAEAAPSKEAVAELHQQLTHISAELERIHQRYAEAVVTRAAVYGWSRIATEQDVSPKQLHTWKTRFLPDIEDLSAIPSRQMRREQKRITALEKHAAAEAHLTKQLQAARDRAQTLKDVSHSE